VPPAWGRACWVVYLPLAGLGPGLRCAARLALALSSSLGARAPALVAPSLPALQACGTSGWLQVALTHTLPQPPAFSGLFGSQIILLFKGENLFLPGGGERKT